MGPYITTVLCSRFGTLQLPSEVIFATKSDHEDFSSTAELRNCLRIGQKISNKTGYIRSKWDLFNRGNQMGKKINLRKKIFL